MKGTLATDLEVLTLFTAMLIIALVLLNFFNPLDNSVANTYSETDKIETTIINKTCYLNGEEVPCRMIGERPERGYKNETR